MKILLNLEELKILAKYIDGDIRAMIVVLGENRNNENYGRAVRADLESCYNLRTKLYTMMEKGSVGVGASEVEAENVSVEVQALCEKVRELIAQHEQGWAKENGTIAKMANNNKQSCRKGHDA